MGIYTNSNRFGGTTDYASQIPANEAYDATFGCAQIIADCAANDRALFEAAIISDVQEVMAIHEGVEVVTEGALSDVLKKIVEMFKKLLAKIKGIFAAFIAKLTGAFKNGKDLVKQYHNQIVKYSNWKGFKLKGIRKPKQLDNLKNQITNAFKASMTNSAYYLSVDYTATEDDVISNVTFKGDNMTPKKIEDMESDDLKLAILKERYLSEEAGKKITDYKELSTEITDYFYDDAETMDGDSDNISSSTFTATWIKGILEDDKWIEDVKKINKHLEEVINKIIDNLNKADDNLAEFERKNPNSRAMATKGNKVYIGASFSKNPKGENPTKSNAVGDQIGFTASGDGAKTEVIRKGIHALQKIASNEQEVVSKVTAEHMAQVKFAIGQARKIWTAAAAYSSGVHKEDTDYTQAIGEYFEEDFYSVMDSIH